MTNELQRLFTKAIFKGYRRNLIPATVGIHNPDGSQSVTVSKRPGWVHVRIGPDGQQGQTTARNSAGVLRFGAPVLVAEIEGVLTVVDVDPAHAEAFAGSSDLGAVRKHTHKRGSGLEYVMESVLFEPGQVQSTGTGFVVQIRGFYYVYGGVWGYFPTSTIDLASYQTATTDNWNWIR